MFETYVTPEMVSTLTNPVLCGYFAQLIADVGHATIALFEPQINGEFIESPSTVLSLNGMREHLRFMGMPQPDHFTYNNLNSFLTMSKAHLGVVSSELYVRGMLNFH